MYDSHWNTQKEVEKRNEVTVQVYYFKKMFLDYFVIMFIQ